jgi:hypothetical protein
MIGTGVPLSKAYSLVQTGKALSSIIAVNPNASTFLNPMIYALAAKRSSRMKADKT